MRIKKVLVALQRVAIERFQIGLLRRKVAKRLRTPGNCVPARIRDRRSFGAALEEHKRYADARRMPGHETALGHIVDPQTSTLEYLIHRQAAFADHFRK